MWVQAIKPERGLITEGEMILKEWGRATEYMTHEHKTGNTGVEGNKQVVETRGEEKAARQGVSRQV